MFICKRDGNGLETGQPAPNRDPGRRAVFNREGVYRDSGMAELALFGRRNSESSRFCYAEFGMRICGRSGITTFSIAEWRNGRPPITVFDVTEQQWIILLHMRVPVFYQIFSQKKARKTSKKARKWTIWIRFFACESDNFWGLVFPTFSNLLFSIKTLLYFMLSPLPLWLY